MITSSQLFGEDVEDGDVVHPDPIALLNLWLPDAAAELRPLAALATIGPDGLPDVRHVLVSDRDEDGVLFHTGTTTRKAAELAARPVAAMTVAWPEIGRQLSLRGDVEQLSPDDAAATFGRRSRYLQLLAWANTPEVALLPLAERRARWAAFDAAHPVLDAPAEWTGYRIRPREITFWRGDPDGPSNRHRYTRTPSGWEAAKLPG
jgi:pyridoxamine 5'-phosphate oxidase